MTPINEKKTGLTASKSAARPALARLLPIAEEHIRFAAYGVFQARVNSGLPGDALADWLAAERELGARQTTART